MRRAGEAAEPITNLETHGAGDLPRWARLLPIIVFQGYLAGTALVFRYGPWKWPMRDGTDLYLFLGVAHLSLFLGYLSAARRRARGYTERVSVKSLLVASIIVNLALYVPTLLWLTNGQVDVGGAFSDPSEAYRRFQEVASAEGETQLVSYARTLLAPILVLALPLTVFYWERFSFRLRLFASVAVGSYFSLFILTGRNKGLVDMLLLSPWLIALRVYSGKLRLSGKRTLFLAIAGIALLIVSEGFFSRNLIGRGGGEDRTEYTDVLGGMRSDEENFMLKHVPESYKPAVRSLSFNQTHGYFALYLALAMPFESAFPVGHSYALQTLERRLSGTTTMADHSYTSRLHAKGLWHKTVFWHTTYTWFASDVSFPGVIVLLFIFGRLFALVWLDSVQGGNPFAVTMFITLVTMLYYFPTNNIILGFPESYVAFWGTLACWMFTRKREASTVSSVARVRSFRMATVRK